MELYSICYFVYISIIFSNIEILVFINILNYILFLYFKLSCSFSLKF